MDNMEEIKKRKDGLDVLQDIYRYADRVTESIKPSIEPEDEALFRWYGIYTQRPAEDGYFMVRVRIPGGDLSAPQVREVANLSRLYGQSLADITVRQNIQLHWVRLENLPVILERLQAVGLSTTEACGDCVRNIINCPVSGVDGNELYDATPLIQDVNNFFLGNRDFSNLPRKFKIAITGCAIRCVYPEINDIGLFAVQEEGRVTFRARVGGGLSTSPRFSKDLGILVDPWEVVDLCAAIATIFRDEGNRANRKKARLKFLIEQWEIPRFRDAVEAHMGRKLTRAVKEEANPVLVNDRSHYGIHEQKERGLFYIGISLIGGRTSAHELYTLADLAHQYGSGKLRTTNKQGVIIPDIPESKLDGVKVELRNSGFNFEPSWSQRGIIACTGIQFCKLAIAETKNRAVDLANHLDNAVQLNETIRISVTGCPNACGQHHICDVGLEGSVTTINGEKKESFQVFLGGGVGKQELFGRRTGIRILSENLNEFLTRLLSLFKTDRYEGESFQEFCLRHTDEELNRVLVNEDNFGGKIKKTRFEVGAGD